MKSPRSMVRFAIRPMRRPGIAAAMKGGSRWSFSERIDRCRVLVLKAGRRERTRAVEGVVRIIMPRLEWKIWGVKTQNLVVVLVVHVGWMLHGEVGSSVCKEEVFWEEW